MRTITLSLPHFGFIVATRAALGAGLGLLMAGRLAEQRRRAAGLALVAFGVASTVVAARWLNRGLAPSGSRSRVVLGVDPRLIGATRYPRKGDEMF